MTLPEKLEQVLIAGDLSPLTPELRVEYYRKVCKSLGLNPLTSPFAYILFKETENAPAKLALYAKKDCAEQLRQIHGVSVVPRTTKREVTDDFATTELSVMNAKGRTDTATGIVYLWRRYNGKDYRLSGQRLADAIMKSETKAKRRATLSICGLGILDEMDLESVRVVGGVTPEGRIYRLPEPEPDGEPPQFNEDAAHGHEPGSEKAKQAEAALKRVEEEDRKLAEERKQKASGSNTAPKPASDQPSAQTAAQTKTAEPKPTAANMPEDKPLGTIELDLTVENDVIIRGDIGNLLELIQKHCTASWGEDQWWHILPADVSTIHAMGQRCRYRVVEILPKSFPRGEKSGAAQSTAIPNTGAKAAPQTSGAKATPAKKTSAAAAASPAGSEPQLVAGIIEQANTQMGRSPRLSVLLRMETSKVGVWMTAWDTKHFPFLIAGKDQQCELFVKQSKSKDGKATFTNIVGLRRIGVKEFDEEGNPLLSVHREPGTPNLFQP